MTASRSDTPPSWRLDPTLDPLGGAERSRYDDPVDFERASEDAVDEARAVMEAGWRRWLEKHEIHPVPALCLAQPRVSVVGERPETWHLVALVRFTFTAEGREYRGFARGPSTAPMFVVERLHDSSEQADAPRRFRWRRRSG